MAAKEILAETAVTCMEQLAELRRRLRTGGIVSSEESRSIPALASNIKRLMDALRLTESVEEEEEGFL